MGVNDLPSNSLIAATHSLADFLAPVVEKIRQEVLSLKVLHADETPHRMLEGDSRSRWYLWGFCGQYSAYFECHDTRSGDVAASFLREASCDVVVSGVFSGYSRAIKLANRERVALGFSAIEKAFCNAHARRRTIFEKMATQAKSDLVSVSSQSLLAKAINYFLGNYGPLTLHLGRADVSIDNNRQERTLRNPVIGRKTWYGTHSRRGAKTTVMLFTIVESCKLAKVNPRQYLPDLVQVLHKGKPPITPAEYRIPPPDDN